MGTSRFGSRRRGGESPHSGRIPKHIVRNPVHSRSDSLSFQDRKPVIWWADAREVLRSCPDEVKLRVGYALDEAQLGGISGSAKPMPSVGRGVYEIRTNHDTETFRTFYVARFAEGIYAFYVVHKKATSGIDLPKHQKDLVVARYKDIVEWRRAAELR